MILEALCRGNYSPPDIVTPADPDYWNANQRVAELMEQLKAQLSPIQYELIEEITSQIYTAQAIECEAYYKLGFATGMAIAQETQELLQQDTL